MGLVVLNHGSAYAMLTWPNNLLGQPRILVFKARHHYRLDFCYHLIQKKFKKNQKKTKKSKVQGHNQD